MLVVKTPITNILAVNRYHKDSWGSHIIAVWGIFRIKTWQTHINALLLHESGTRVSSCI